ncbi:MAG: hypothetical protein ACLQDC_06450 [Verrucomicrobiia bacterium]
MAIIGAQGSFFGLGVEGNDKFFGLFLFGWFDEREPENTLRRMGDYDFPFLARFCVWITKHADFQKVGSEGIQSRQPADSESRYQFDYNLFHWILFSQQIKLGFYQFCEVIGWEG